MLLVPNTPATPLVGCRQLAAPRGTTPGTHHAQPRAPRAAARTHLGPEPLEPGPGQAQLQAQVVRPGAVRLGLLRAGQRARRGEGGARQGKGGVRAWRGLLAARGHRPRTRMPRSRLRSSNPDPDPNPKAARPTTPTHPDAPQPAAQLVAPWVLALVRARQLCHRLEPHQARRQAAARQAAAGGVLTCHQHPRDTQGAPGEV